MDIKARKYKLIEKLMHLDEEQIDSLENFLDQESELSKSLGRSMKEVEEGKVTPHSEVRKKYQKWL